jgi:hypothetical protein
MFMANTTVVVRPRTIDDVLVNPGIGFMTFQRFNGDTLNEGKSWTEGYPIDYQDFKGSLENENHPMTSVAYFRVYWRFMEPEKGNYRWDLIDNALKTARQRKQTLMLRIAPHGTNDKEDVPGWYRKIVGDSKNWPNNKWMVNPEDPNYVEHFGSFIRELGKRYNGHPYLESVDLSIISAWGEGESSELLTKKTREALIDAYTDTFTDTPLLMMLNDKNTNMYGLSKADVGYRADCLGDMRSGWTVPADFHEFEPGGWSHMFDLYPRLIIEAGMQNAWKKAPVSFEVCWVVQHWMDMGWDIDYIIDQSLKWHISSFNAKSSPIPKEWQPNVDRWLKKMGYRLALRRFTYPGVVKPGDRLDFTSWWENMGVAPCYKKFLLAYRIKGDKYSKTMVTDADITDWLPGDSIHDSAVDVPDDIPHGSYEIQVSIIDRNSGEPKVKLAMEGLQPDGWYTLGAITVE